MMAAKPVIQSIDAGNNMVEEAQCGINIEPENVEEIIHGVKYIMDLPEKKWLEMGANGKKFAQKHHDYQKLARKFIEICQ